MLWKNISVNIFNISNLQSVNFHKNKDVTAGECEAQMFHSFSFILPLLHLFSPLLVLVLKY